MKMILLLQRKTIESALFLMFPLWKQCKQCIPLALTRNLKLDIINSITRGRVAVGILGGCELGTKDLVVRILRVLLGFFIERDLLLVVGDLENDELGLVGFAAALMELFEGSQGLVLDGDTGSIRLESANHILQPTNIIRVQ